MASEDDLCAAISQIKITPDDEKNEEAEYIKMMERMFLKYAEFGPRSPEKVKIPHGFVKKLIDNFIAKYPHLAKIYRCELEKCVDSLNATNKKKCDIVIYKYDEVFAIFPLKAPMTNYMKNRNNSWEGVTGECVHLDIANKKNVAIIPINLLFNKMPCLKDGNIDKFDNVKYSKSLKVYEGLIEYGTINQTMNFIFDVEHNSEIGGEYKTAPNILNFNCDTPFKSMASVLEKIIDIDP